MAEIANYGTINAAGQFSVNPGVALSTQTHFMNLATNTPVTVGQLVTMVKMGAISADGTFDPASPLSLGLDFGSVLPTPGDASLPPVGQLLTSASDNPQSELAKLGSFDAAGQFTLNPGVATNQKTNFFAINPVSGKSSALNVGQVQLMIRLGAIKPDGTNNPAAFASRIVYQPPAPSIRPGVAVVDPASLSIPDNLSFSDGDNLAAPVTSINLLVRNHTFLDFLKDEIS